MPIEYALVAGAVGAFFSLLFLLGKEKLKPLKWHSWIVFFVPLVCFVIIPFDHTSKVEIGRASCRTECRWRWTKDEEQKRTDGDDGTRRRRISERKSRRQASRG